MLDLTGHGAELRRLTRSDADPRVRHRADALLLLAHGRSVDEAAHDMGCCAKRIRVWRRRFLAEGRQGAGGSAPPGTPPEAECSSAGGAGVRLGRLPAGLWLSGDHLDGGRLGRSARAARLDGQSGDRLAHAGGGWATATVARVMI